MLLRLIAPVAMGLGFTRRKVYDLFLWLTRQALNDSDGSAEKVVGELDPLHTYATDRFCRLRQEILHNGLQR